jgi:hypothetical protein
MIGLSPQAMKNCLWSCVAYKKFPYQERVSMNHMLTIMGEVIPAMPMFPFELMDDLVKFMVLTTQGPEGSMLHLYNDSLMVAWEASSVPLAGNQDMMPEPYRSSTAAANDRMDNLYPRGLERENIGSNKGLALIMRRFYDDRKMGTPDCKVYSALSVDVNIFDRMLKVIVLNTFRPCSINLFCLDVLRCF